MSTAAATQQRVIRRKADSVAEAGYKRDLHQQAIDRHEARKDLHTRAERLAGDRICQMNWRWPEAAEDFIDEPWLRCVRKYFRDAEGGPLLIDEPTTPEELVRCERKAVKLRARGYRYAILRFGATEADDIMELGR